MVPQCRVCGRVRWDGKWQWSEAIQPGRMVDRCDECVRALVEARAVRMAREPEPVEARS